LYPSLYRYAYLAWHKSIPKFQRIVFKSIITRRKNDS
jgi:hypothetical protein